MDPEALIAPAGDQRPGPTDSQRRHSSGGAVAADDLPSVAGQKRRRGGGRVSMSYPRKRAVTACQLCRARKTKCDNQRPTCGFCASSNLVCQYEDRKDHSSFDPASLEMLDRLNRILEVQDNVLDVVHTIKMGMARQDPTEECPLAYRTSVPVTSSGTAYPFTEGNDRSQLASDDQVNISSAHTVPESILGWPVFENRYPGKFLGDAVFASAYPSMEEDGQALHGVSSQQRPMRRVMDGFQEEEVPALIQRFIDLVHIKNPVLDEGRLKKMARRVTEEGLTWDGTSCLVLLACALGAIATPFKEAYDQAVLDPQEYRNLPSLLDRGNLDKAEGYFTLAQRRIGLLNQSILACQCYFISGVYLMYSFQPLKAFQSFHQASITYQIYSKSVAASPQARRHQKLEERLFWSCFKSECEILSEIDLPQSGVAHLGYIHTFPQPPDPESTDWEPDPAVSPEALFSASETSSVGNPLLNDVSQRQQQQSWFYYLSEIALRRIGNRVLNYFYQDGHESWATASLQSITQAADEFLHQLDQWYECLPAPVRYSEEQVHQIPNEELPYMLRTRAIEIRSWILRPFLYRAIHCSTGSSDEVMLGSRVEEAIRCCTQLIEANSLRHRHHGTWYTLRLSTTSALSIYAAEKRGLAPDGWLRTIQLAIETLLYWENEGSDGMHKARLVLQELVAERTYRDSVT